MKVILKDDIKSVGKMGEVVSVADGYARNFLIPKGFAVGASTRNIKALEHEKRVIEAGAKKVRQGARLLSEKISSMTLTVKAKAGEEDKLFGSITTMDIADALKAEGVTVDRRKIVIEEPIKRLGGYTVTVKLHTDEAPELKIQVVAE
ncbi:MAG: 50S ribosomal protein L9 [Thermodesulfovibrionales bacterium]|nr:50S ribosomal protein L9 [Thermodesulfovibrionales bacterium]